jgi:hypothetical protein
MHDRDCNENRCPSKNNYMNTTSTVRAYTLLGAIVGAMMVYTLIGLRADSVSWQYITEDEIQRHSRLYTLHREADEREVEKMKKDYEHYTDLIIVACHAVYTKLDYLNIESDESWSLPDFSKGQAHVFSKHIKRAIELSKYPPHLYVSLFGEPRVCEERLVTQ